MNATLLTDGPQFDPAAIYRRRDGIYATDLLITGLVWLDFFSWLARKPADVATICRELGLAERPVDVMLTYFAAAGFVVEKGGGFEVTALAREHLVQGSPWFIGPYYGSLKDRPVCLDLLKVLRTGRPANWGSSAREQEWSKAMESDEFARGFTAAMDCRGAFLGRALARAVDCGGRRRLLDIGGGSGIYACAFAANHPQLTAAVFEKPPVDRIARTLIAERGFAEKVSVIAGDMFGAPLPTGFDLHLLSNVLHDWDVPVVRDLLARSFAALEPGGVLVIHDMHLNAAKDGPLAAAEYSVILMHSTEGRIYSVAEMEAWLTAAGFGEVTFQPTAADRSVMTARKPKAGC